MTREISLAKSVPSAGRNPNSSPDQLITERSHARAACSTTRSAAKQPEICIVSMPWQVFAAEDDVGRADHMTSTVGEALHKILDRRHVGSLRTSAWKGCLCATYRLPSRINRFGCAVEVVFAPSVADRDEDALAAFFVLHCERRRDGSRQCSYPCRCRPVRR